MYRVWFEGFIDRYYKNYDRACDACKDFIKKFGDEETPKLLHRFAMIDECDICGIVKIKCEDEIEELARTTEKKKYRVTFTKYETIEVEAYNEDEAEELAVEILDEDAYAWDSPADRITVELMED